MAAAAVSVGYLANATIPPMTTAQKASLDRI